MSVVESELAELGFSLVTQRRDGSRRYTSRANAYLVYWVTAHSDGGGELTWEFELGQYLRDRGLSVSGQDELSLLLFPGSEVRGQFEPGWPTAAVAEAERVLGSLDFVAGS